MDQDRVEKNIRFIETHYEEFQAGKLESVLQRFDPDIVMIEPENLPYGGIWRGRDGIRKQCDVIFDTWSEVRLWDFKHIADEDTIVSFFSCEAKSRKTGKTVTYRMCERFYIQNDMIKEQEVFCSDTHLVLVANGLA